MARHMPKPCLEHRCPELAEPGRSYCQAHAKQSPSSKVTQSTRWRKLRREMIDSAPRPLTCGICGHAIHDESQLQVDHIKPISEGGAGYEPSNLRLSHAKCNSRGYDKRKPKPSAAGRQPPWMIA